MNVRITQLDGHLPNLALMRLSAWHKAQGDAVTFKTFPAPDLFEPEYDIVYASAIFTLPVSSLALAMLTLYFPNAIIGGTGTPSKAVVEDIVPADFTGLDYEPWENFTASIGFTQRGCRLKCSFCVVPGKEGKPKSVATIADIWRGAPWPRKIHLLDNDCFGNPEWRERLAEVRGGGFKVCFNQGINVRILTNEIARELATVEYRDDSFQRRRLYTAWDNIGDERIFFRGVDRLEAAGIPPQHLMAYMLIGYDPDETWPMIFERFDKMVARGIRPFPMPYDRTSRQHTQFQRWVIRREYLWKTFEDYQRGDVTTDDEPVMFA